MELTNYIDAKRMSGMEMVPVSINGGTPVPFPSGDPFLLTPNHYGPLVTGASSIDMTNQGLHSIYAKIDGPPVLWDGEAHCVVDPVAPDVEMLVRALMARNLYGNRDDRKTNAQLLSDIRLQPISVACTTQAFFTQYVLNLYSIPNRPALLVTADMENQVTDGHTIIEVKVNGSWVLYDMSFCRKWQIAGVDASLAQIMDAGIANCTEVMLWYPAYEGMLWDTTQKTTRLDSVVLNGFLTPGSRATSSQRDFQLPALYLSSTVTISGTTYPIGWYFYVPGAYAATGQAIIAGYSSSYNVVSRAIWDQLFPA